MILLLKLIYLYVTIQYGVKSSFPFFESITLLDDILFCLVLGIVISKKQIFLKCPKYITFSLVLVIGIGIASGIMNDSPWYVTFLGLRGYLQYLLLFYIIINLNIDKAQLIKLCNFAINSFLIIQIPVIIFQFLSGIYKGDLNVDFITGTFGQSGANYLSYTAVIPLFFMIGIVIEGKKYNIYQMIKVILLLVIMISGQGRFSIILTPFIFIWIYKTKILTHKMIKKWFLRGCILSGVIFALYLACVGFRELKFYNLYSFTKGEFNALSGGGRFVWIGLLWKYVDKDWMHFLIGYGPGEFWSYISVVLERPLVIKTYNLWGQLQAGLDAGCDSEIVAGVGELGIIGFIALMFIYFKNYMLAMSLFRKNYNPEIRILSIPVIAGSIMMIVGSYVNLLWEYQNLVFYYWFFAGVWYKLYLLLGEG